MREHHWVPNIISNLYTDSVDHFGIEYWYDDIVKMIEELKPKPKEEKK